MTNSKKNLGTMIVALLGVLNTMSMNFGWYHLDSKSLQTVDNYVSYIVVVIGVILSHRQPVKYYVGKVKSFFVK